MKDSPSTSPETEAVQADRITGKTIKSAREKPPRCVIDVAGIPPSLKKPVIYLAWKWVWKPDRKGDPDGPGKWTKPPYHAATLRPTDATNEANLSTFAVAIAAYDSGKADGIGIALQHAGLCGYDLDDVRDPATGEIDPTAREELLALDTYCEISPSGTGLKALVIGRKPDDPTRKKPASRVGNRELYDAVRYFTITGQRSGIEGLQVEPQPRQEQLTALYWKLFPPVEKQKATDTKKAATATVDKTDQELLTKAFAAKNGQRIQDLYLRGQGVADDSANDLALASYLAFYFPDAARLEAVLSHSKLAEREKWKRDDYRASTIEKAYEGITQFYNPRPPRVNVVFGKGTQAPSGEPADAEASSGEDATPNPDGAEAGIPRTWDDPARLAEGFLETRTLVYVKNTAFLYSGRCYQAVADATVQDQLWKHCEAEAAKEYLRLMREYEAAKLAAEALGEEAIGLKEPVIAKINHGTTTNAVGAVRSRCRKSDGTLPGEWIGGDLSRPTVLGVANGLLDKRTLRDHSPEWFSLAALPVPFQPKAPKPDRFLKVLGELLQGKEDLIALVQEIFGACLDPELTWKHFTAFVGPGDNGKSVVLAVLRAMLGADNYSGTPLQQLASNRFAAFTLFGKLANISGDESYFESADEGMIKALTGEAEMQFEQKNKTPFVGRNTAKLIFGCNAVPKFSDKSEATWNRLILVPFNYVVPASKKDPRLLDPKFWAAELPGVLLWSLEGLERYKRVGRVTFCQDAVKAAEVHRIESNPARLFILENYALSPGGIVPARDIFGAYRQWCDDHGYTHRLTSVGLGHEIGRAFPDAVSKPTWFQGGTVQMWRGIRTQTAG